MNPERDSRDLSRRDFVKTGVAAAAMAAAPAILRGEEPPSTSQPAEEKKPAAPARLVPTRPLGKSGVKVSMLNYGAGRTPDARRLNAMWEAGIRYLDTADCYGKGESEKAIGEWLRKTGRRKDVFLVTKDHPKTPDEWVEMLDRRLEALQTDYVDLFFLHAIGGGRRGGSGGDDVGKLTSKEWARAAEKMKKSGKARLVGWSSHAEFPARSDLLTASAKDSWVDAAMIAYDPQLVRDNADFNKALDACHQAGVGLISMKQMRAVSDVEKFLPEFKELGLSTHQAVLHGVWSDERIASICCEMPNVDIIKENAEAARKFKPLEKKKLAAVAALYRREGRRFCNGCDGSCRRAAKTDAALGALVRCLSYAELDGRREHARQVYAALSPEERDWHAADLAAATAACKSRVDFAALLPRVDEKLT